MHYGLAAPLYTHFTSPIRRYADVVVHRLLNAALGLERPDASLQDGDALKATAENINSRHRNSQSAGRASVELHTHIFFKKNKAETDARVIRVRANGIIVFVPKFGIEAPVLFDEDESVYMIEDLASTNGTKLNGKRVRSAALSEGDEIQIGQTLFRFEVIKPESKGKGNKRLRIQLHD